MMCVKKRTKVINHLKKQACKAYYLSIPPDYMDCGVEMASHITGRDYKGERDKYKNLCNRLKRIDPCCP